MIGFAPFFYKSTIDGASMDAVYTLRPNYICYPHLLLNKSLIYRFAVISFGAHCVKQYERSHGRKTVIYRSQETDTLIYVFRRHAQCYRPEIIAAVSPNTHRQEIGRVFQAFSQFHSTAERAP